MLHPALCSTLRPPSPLTSSKTMTRGFLHSCHCRRNEFLCLLTPFLRRHRPASYSQRCLYGCCVKWRSEGVICTAPKVSAPTTPFIHILWKQYYVNCWAQEHFNHSHWHQQLWSITLNLHQSMTHRWPEQWHPVSLVEWIYHVPGSRMHHRASMGPKFKRGLP